MAIIFGRDAIDEGVANPRGNTVVIVNIAMVTVAGALVVARFWTRVVVNNLVGSDDWSILGALVSEQHHLCEKHFSRFLTWCLSSWCP